MTTKKAKKPIIVTSAAGNQVQVYESKPIDYSNRPSRATGAPLGRPTKYKEEYSSGELNNYLEIAQDQWDEYEKSVRYDKDGNITSEEKGRQLRACFPTHEGYAEYLSMPVKTLYAWAGKFPEFRRALDVINQKQKQQVLYASASGLYSPIIGKLILSANHGMSEKTVVEHEVTMKEMITNQEQAESISWDDSAHHLTELQEANGEDIEE